LQFKYISQFIFFKKLLGFGFILFLLGGGIKTGWAHKGEAWRSLPIQHNGRVKPFDTFCREILRTVYGKETFQDRLAVDVILSWLILPDHWDQYAFIAIKDRRLKQSLDLNQDLNHFSPQELKTNQKFIMQLTELQSLRQRQETLDNYFDHLETVELRLRLYEAVKSSWLLKIFPHKDQWLSPSEMKGEPFLKFKAALSSYVQWVSTDSKEAETQLKTALDEFKSLSLGDPAWYQETKIQVELFYNQFKPFFVATILYGLFLFLIIVLVFIHRISLMSWFVPLVVLGFLIHGLGMACRSYIMSRPPVSNMYETVLWVPWVALIAGMIFYRFKQRMAFIASVILAFVCLFLTHIAFEILDDRLQPLEAVLRSSFWLSTHVLIITMSYSFFFLAFVLGDIGLFYFLVKKKLTWVKKMFQPMYRSIQWGVIFLTAGTILGAIWADYSWGRFWGWDPKESWALISLLSYLALLHGRFIGVFKAFSFSVASVLMFFLVVMAWYGVNFILGKGLHSYGFGSGGVEYVAGAFVLHILLAAAATFQYLKHST